LRYPLVGETGKRRFDGINFKPLKLLENAQTPTSRVHAVLGGFHERTTPSLKKNSTAILTKLLHAPLTLLANPSNKAGSIYFLSPHIKWLRRSLAVPDQFNHAWLLLYWRIGAELIMAENLLLESSIKNKVSSLPATDFSGKHDPWSGGVPCLLYNSSPHICQLVENKLLQRCYFI